MSSELVEKIKEYKKNLEKDLKTAKEERQKIVDKVSAGDKLSIKENSKNKKLAKLVKEIQENFNEIKELDGYAKIEEQLTELADSKTPKDKKDKIIKSLIKQFETIIKKHSKKLEDIEGLEKDDLKDIKATKAKLEKEIKDLELELTFAKKRGTDTEDIEIDIQEKKDIVEKIDDYLKSSIDKTKLEEDLKKLSYDKTNKAEKQKIIDKYKSIVEEDKKSLIENIEEKIENYKPYSKDEEKKSLVKDTLTKTGDALKNNWKTIAKICGCAVLIAVIIATAKSCTKDNKKTNNNKASYGVTTIAPESEVTEVIYDDITAVPGYNSTYHADYEFIKSKYIIPASDSVDLVNRAANILSTNFYVDASIPEIVEVLTAIDDKELFLSDNANLDQSINATLTEVYTNNAFGETTEADITKINAFQHFAKEGSELDKFLTEYRKIVQAVLRNEPNARNEMYNFLNVFANSYAGYIPSDTELTTINENAIIKDTFDWYIAYNSFVRPLMSMYINDENVNDFICLQTTLSSNADKWIIINGCDGTVLALGGE